MVATGLFFGVDGQTTRSLGVDWPASPEETVYTKPYIISSFPPNTLPAASSTDHSASSTLTQQAPTIHNSALHIRSSLSLQPVQTLRFPFIEDPPSVASPPPTTAKGGAAKAPVPPPPHTLRLLTTTPGTGPSAPTFVLSTPTDRAALASEGSTLWALIPSPWGAQVDELVHAGKYSDALALLGVVPVQPDPTKHIQGLRAVQLFKEGSYANAVEMFLELDTNPAKVIALYPETISGRLSAPKEKWIELFGGDSSAKKADPVDAEEKSVAVVEGVNDDEAQKLAANVGVIPASPPEVAYSPPTTSSGGLTGKLRAGLGAVGIRDSDADSIREAPVPKAKKGAGKCYLPCLSCWPQVYLPPQTISRSRLAHWICSSSTVARRFQKLFSISESLQLNPPTFRRSLQRLSTNSWLSLVHLLRNLIRTNSCVPHSWWTLPCSACT